MGLSVGLVATCNCSKQ